MKLIARAIDMINFSAQENVIKRIAQIIEAYYNTITKSQKNNNFFKNYLGGKLIEKPTLIWNRNKLNLSYVNCYSEKLAKH